MANRKKPRTRTSSGVVVDDSLPLLDLMQAPSLIPPLAALAAREAIDSVEWTPHNPQRVEVADAIVGIANTEPSSVEIKLIAAEHAPPTVPNRKHDIAAGQVITAQERRRRNSILKSRADRIGDNRTWRTHPVGIALREAGLCDSESNDYFFRMKPDPNYCGKSRLLTHPVRVQWNEDQPILSVNTEDALLLPYVQRIIQVTGMTPKIEEAKDWHHGLDLATSEDYHELLGTLHLTTPDDVGSGVQDNLCSGRLRLSEAREIMAAIGVREPDDMSRDFLRKNLSVGLALPLPCLNGGSETQQAWAIIHGMEIGVISTPCKALDFALLLADGIKKQLGTVSSEWETKRAER